MKAVVFERTGKPEEVLHLGDVPAPAADAGEMLVVPKGVEHKPYAAGEAQVLLIEPKGVVNTGDGATSERTATNDVWI